MNMVKINFSLSFSSGSQEQVIKLVQLDHPSPSTSLQTLKYHDGFLGQRLGPIGSLYFHPQRLLLAAITSDSILSLYTMKRE